jgi:hypothetical protein
MFSEAPTMWSGLFMVEGYSQTKGILGIGNSFNSNVFVVGGYGWRIDYYLDGYTQENANCIGFGLGLDRPPDAADDEEEDVVKGQFSFALLDEDGAARHYSPRAAQAILQCSRRRGRPGTIGVQPFAESRRHDSR